MTTTVVAKKTFAHGVHPPTHKDGTVKREIRQFPFANVLIIALSQHLGAPAKPIVREGQEVRRGEKIAEASGFVSVTMHAPVSGIIKKIGWAPSLTGKMVMSIFLESYPASGQTVEPSAPCDVNTATPEEIIAAIQEAGIVGLGGAAFPTHVKLKVPPDKAVDTLIINGVECEPYLTTDHRVMLEQQDDIFMGIRYILKATGAKRAIIGVEANKPDAILSLRENIPSDLPVTVEAVKVKYPQGAEKMLITALLDREVPSGGLPADSGSVVVNVATTAEIGRLLPLGRGIIERSITITGPGVEKSGNYLIQIGTPLRYALEQAGLKKNATRVILGGPMMGFTVSSLDVPITKGTSGLLVLTDHESQLTIRKEYPCIGCSHCLDACPIFLNPSRLGRLAKFKQYDAMAGEYNLMDCFECGSCSYVCPSNIPLVHYFRVAKGIIRDKKAAS
ncbi:MAG: electron transport complex subunit RsxC [Deferribacteres bacterium]|nr:electron transport complex subunit RsxC [candidate division KSB1 bacterium]MCB9500684.1 electron transport complex subunit RsxC [Deferribacteres bacterium]